MSNFRVFVHGTNFAVRDAEDRKVRRLGFYATRFVEARDSMTAENLVIDVIRKELESFVLNDHSDPPVMYVEEITEIEDFGDNPVPGEGFTWYPEEGENEKGTARET